jgi:hypothetical protein
MSEEKGEGLKDFFESLPDNVEGRFFNSKIDQKPMMQVDYCVKGYGFGSFRLYTDKDGKLHCDNECSSRDRLKSIMNSLFDQMILDDDE